MYGSTGTEHTLDVLDKKHVKFDQALDFLIFYQGSLGQLQEKPRKNIEKRKVIFSRGGGYRGTLPNMS